MSPESSNSKNSPDSRENISFSNNKEQFDTLWNLISDSIIKIDLNLWRIVDANRSFTQIFRFHETEVHNLDFNLLWPDDSSKIKFIKELKREKEVINFDTKMVTKSGQHLDVLINARFTGGEETKLYFVIIRNISEARETQNALQEATTRADRSEKLKAEFLAQISHEIRTPVNTILSFSSLIENELYSVIPENIRFGFKMIDNGGRRLIRTIDLILNMSELHTGNYKSVKQYFNLEEVVLMPVIREINSIALEKNLTLTYNPKIFIEPIIYGDIYTVTQIFINLIENAIKYTPSGNVEIVLNEDLNGNYYVEVNDTGIGISADYIKQLYEPFSQEDSGYTRKYEGTGLGLALVKKCCEINSAIINVYSKKDEGTKFTITFKNNT